MPKSPNQKLKLIYILNYLMEYSDESHPISMERILSMLSENGIECERKSIYSDISALNELDNIEISLKRGKNGGYYISYREFELPELKLLVDIVQSAKFITAKKSNELIKKIESLTNKYEAQMLQSEVYVANRVKTMNESIYFLVDEISEAINSNKKITFSYLEWTLDKKKVPKHSGELYKVSPIMLSWDDENYYMIAYSDKDNDIRHYRVDKMKNITVIDEKREGVKQNDDPALYSRKLFGMFGGKDENVTLECANSKIGVILDRFGTQRAILKRDDGFFEITVNVVVSPQFFGWITSLEGDVRIKAPQSVQDKYKDFLEKSIINI